jgi:tetratricopeptide (TPR) repeat protein
MTENRAPHNRQPNHLLRELLRESGWSGEELARAVNHVGAGSGRDLRYQRASVHQWLAGTLPRPPGPELVCEALSRRLGRPVGLAEAGFLPAGATAHREADAPDTLLRALGEAARRPERHPGLLSVRYGSSDPGAQLAAASVPRSPHDEVPGRLTNRQVETAGTMLAVFSASDRAYGGGHARLALAGYLAHTVGPLLRLPGRPMLRLRLLADAAQLSYLCGFMHVDDELNGLAERYYQASLRLAETAGDLPTQALALRAMSIQAHTLGHRPAALSLARAAAERSARCRSPRVRAGVLGQLAVTEAAAGHPQDALRELDRSRQLVADIDGPAPAIGEYHLGSCDHTHAVVAAELGEHASAVRSLKASATRRPRTEVRSRAVVSSRLAETHLASGHLEAACAAWHEFLDRYPHLESRRAESARRRLLRLLLPHRRRSDAEHLIRRATALRRA